MKILGHGIDIVSIEDLQRWVEHPRDPFIQRCFVRAELDEIGEGMDRLERLAGKFAAKEAVLKAIGTGFGANVAFTDVEILRAPGAAPEVRLSRQAANAATALGITDWKLSISHTAGMAIASAIALS